MPTLEGLVGLLLERYGPQGWWPLLEPVGPEREWRCVYRPGDYRLPAEPLQRFEIGVGAILTQNTGWPGVIRALINLRRADRLAPDALLDETAAAEIRQLIRPSGYFNQKQLRLRTWAGFFNELNGRAPQRSQLLALNGIGPETADSILVYAYGQAQFIAEEIRKKVDYIISDGAVYLLDDHRMMSISHGDLHHYSIAAASVLAKVTRDSMMEDFAKAFPNYGFEKHMGYGTKQHLEAIKDYAICDIHRRSYEPIKSLVIGGKKIV